ncbi:MAG: alpha/beta fold hydrolase [Pelagimonas sp.]|uniref:alpha/beta fold hydrolase n=1 Tax=Pelagimonas sp. TaxID=2073170 RepID=UPI003D6B8831
MTPLYLHGLPGSAAELALGSSNIPVLDRNAPSFAQLALRLPDGPLHLIGFSLGAACALRLAVLAPDKIGQLTLISAAAPLDLGDFLPDMAGAAVFRAARSHAQLSALTAVQSTMARFTPGLMARMLARGTAPQEAGLITGPAVQTALSQGLTDNKHIYLRELPAYVQPWAHHLTQVRCPVALIHGQADTWAPPAMALALHHALPDATLTMMPELGHYACLQHALKQQPGPFQ